jgi:hypothetical protein
MEDYQREAYLKYQSRLLAKERPSMFPNQQPPHNPRSNVEKEVKVIEHRISKFNFTSSSESSREPTEESKYAHTPKPIRISEYGSSFLTN